MPIQKGVKEEEEEEKEAKQKDPLRIMYASLHDIWSYRACPSSFLAHSKSGLRFPPETRLSFC